MPNAENYVTVTDLKKGKYRTFRGKPQEGIAFVCLEHGIQPFVELWWEHPDDLNSGVALGCGCEFEVLPDGAIRRRA